MGSRRGCAWSTSVGRTLSPTWRRTPACSTSLPRVRPGGRPAKPAWRGKARGTRGVMGFGRQQALQPLSSAPAARSPCPRLARARGNCRRRRRRRRRRRAAPQASRRRIRPRRCARCCCAAGWCGGATTSTRSLRPARSWPSTRASWCSGGGQRRWWAGAGRGGRGCWSAAGQAWRQRRGGHGWRCPRLHPAGLPVCCVRRGGAWPQAGQLTGAWRANGEKSEQNKEGQSVGEGQARSPQEPSQHGSALPHVPLRCVAAASYFCSFYG